MLEMVDPVLDTTRVPPMPRGSYNRSVAHARELLERDPGRRYAYGVIGFMHAIAAGWWGRHPFGASRREEASFAATLMAPNTAVFAVVLRDTFELVRDTVFDSIPQAEQARLRRHAADEGMRWMQRWLVAGPSDADAHLWASRLAALQDDYALALRQTDTALALGVESPIEFAPGRRVMLLVRLGRAAEAAALADSLLTAEAWRRPMLPNLDRGWSFAVGALLLARQFTRAVELANLGARQDRPGRTRCMELYEFVGPDNVPSLPGDIARAAIDTILTHGTAEAELQPCWGTLQRLRQAAER